MISRIRLEDWRAYSELHLPLGSGTTFVVAPNGIGKTSLVEAAAWALFGDAARRPEGAVRLGRPEAAAEVDVDLPHGKRLTIRRRLPPGGPRTAAPPPEATLDGVRLAPDDIAIRLRQAFGADPALLARLAMIRSLDKPDDAAAPDLQQHLCEQFGIDGLQAAVVHLNNVLKDTARATRDIKKSTGATLKALEGLREQHADAEAAAAGARTAHDEAAEAAAAAAALVRDAIAARTAHDEMVRRVAALREVAAAADPPIPRSTANADVPKVLEERERAHQQAADNARADAAAHTARARAAQTALAELDVADADCPVCLRPLGPEDTARARAQHLAEVEQAGQAAAAARAAEEQALARLAAARHLSAEARRLAPPPALPADAPPSPVLTDAELAAAREAAEAAAAAMQAAADALVEARSAAMAARHRADQAQQDIEARDALVAHYSREAAATTAKDAAEATIKTLLDQTIEPLADEISNRWKTLFPDRGPLGLDASGAVRRTVNGLPLPFGSFSTGERMAAQVLLRLLVLQSATRSTFIWIDEPLEHLDPASRRHVASLLARAARPDSVQQIVVTTYEEPLARRLEARDPDRVRLVHVRPGGGN